ncbi:putative membrane protein [Escherichia coli 2-177-06_S3_C1]|nr:putative membrane protein [Escherichia coli 2-177-06_S3_C1]
MYSLLHSLPIKTFADLFVILLFISITLLYMVIFNYLYLFL